MRYAYICWFYLLGLCVLPYLFIGLKDFEKIKIYPIFSTPIQRNIWSMLHAICTLRFSQCQRIYTLYFPWHSRVYFTAVKCIYSHRFITNLRCRVHYMAHASRSRHFMQQTNQNTHIRTLNAKTIHPNINLYCVCVCVCVCVYIYIYLYVCVCVCEHVGVCIYVYHIFL